MAGAHEVEDAPVARLIGDRTPAAFLDVLMETPPRSLTELARKAGVTPATASVHLSIREALIAARTCYDHIAGRLGVRLTDALLGDGILAPNGEGFVLTAEGRARFEGFGVDIATLERKRRPLARACLDWTERRHHLAGALGAALAAELFERRWVVRTGHSRAVRLTAAGTRALADEFGLDVQRTYSTDRVI